MKHRVRGVGTADLDGAARDIASQRAAAQDLSGVHDQRAVVEDQREVVAEQLGDSPRGGVAASGDEQKPHTAFPRQPDRERRSRRDRLVAAQQRSVDVEREQPYRPSQISILSMTSPGRIWSTTSIPLATQPNDV
jgi:hypothetical protein